MNMTVMFSDQNNIFNCDEPESQSLQNSTMLFYNSQMVTFSVAVQDVISGNVSLLKASIKNKCKLQLGRCGTEVLLERGGPLVTLPAPRAGGNNDAKKRVNLYLFAIQTN
jgi:hypothetical protein